jgi:hypothetical protein
MSSALRIVWSVRAALNTWPRILGVIALPLLVGLASGPAGAVVALLLAPAFTAIASGLLKPVAGSREGVWVEVVLAFSGITASAAAILFLSAGEEWLTVSAVAAVVVTLGTVGFLELERRIDA